MSHPAAPTRRYLTLTEAGDIAHLSPRTLKRAIEAKNLLAHRIGRLIRLEEAELYRWLEAGGTPAKAHRPAAA